MNSTLNSTVTLRYLFYPICLLLFDFSVSLLLTVSFAWCRKTYLKKMLTLKKIHIFSSLYTQLFSAISQVDKLAQVKNSSDSFFFSWQVLWFWHFSWGGSTRHQCSPCWIGKHWEWDLSSWWATTVVKFILFNSYWNLLVDLKLCLIF